MANEVVKYKNEDEILNAGQRYLAEVTETKITSQDKFLRMTHLVQDAKRFQKAVDEFFDPIKKPAYDSLQAIYAKIKESKKYFEDAEKIGKQRMGGWRQLQQKKESERRARELEKAKETGSVAPPVTPARAARVEAKAEGVAYQENYEVEVVDIQELLTAIVKGKIAPTFVDPNMGAIKRFANNTKGETPIPGVKITRQDIIKVSR